jgi:hypothetical protein
MHGTESYTLSCRAKPPNISGFTPDVEIALIKVLQKEEIEALHIELWMQ